MRVTVRVIDINRRTPVRGAFVDFGGATGYTDARGEVTFDATVGTYPLRVLHRDYTPYSTVITVRRAGVIEVELVPQVRIL